LKMVLMKAMPATLAPSEKASARSSLLRELLLISP
jgi:hypothetical protein